VVGVSDIRGAMSFADPSRRGRPRRIRRIRALAAVIPVCWAAAAAAPTAAPWPAVAAQTPPLVLIPAGATDRSVTGL
jgi:hypothetical protein